MKKNGFTLIELLSVIVLIGLLLGIGVPGVMRIRSNMQRKSLNTKLKQVEQAATLWGQDNKTLINETNCETTDASSCTTVSIKKLIDDDYLDGEMNKKEFKNPVSGKDLVTIDCNVEVYKKNNRVYATINSNTCQDDGI